jgi:hypothetical protein
VYKLERIKKETVVDCGLLVYDPMVTDVSKEATTLKMAVFLVVAPCRLV